MASLKLQRGEHGYISPKEPELLGAGPHPSEGPQAIGQWLGQTVGIIFGCARVNGRLDIDFSGCRMTNVGLNLMHLS